MKERITISLILLLTKGAVLWNDQQSWKKNCRLVQVLAQSPFTTSETEPDYYHQKVSVPVASQVDGQLKLRLGNFKKMPETPEFVVSTYPANQKSKF